MSNWMIAILAPGLSFGPLFLAGGPADVTGPQIAGVVLTTAALLILAKVVQRQSQTIESLQRRLESRAGEG